MRIRISVLILLLPLAGCGLDETLRRSDAPLTREAAAKKLSTPFPSSAKDIYYLLQAGGMQEYHFFERFTVRPEDLEKAVNERVSDFEQRMHEAGSCVRLPIGSAPRAPEYPQFLPMPWWNPDTITNGYYCGSTGSNSRPFHVWVDVSHHTIYLCETD